MYIKTLLPLCINASRKSLTIKLTTIFLTIVILFNLSVIPILAARTYTYDANGNMTRDGDKCYEYNEANQLKIVRDCNTKKLIADYVYDYQGNRIVKKQFKNGSLQKTTYAPDDGFERTKLASNSAVENTTYYMANDEVVAKKNPDGSKTYYQGDHIGSNSLLTNETGTVVEKTTYEPFGEVRAGGTVSKFQYTGQEKDSETGLNYYGARYYDSHIHRFAQPDPIIQDIYDPQSLNRYSYVRNNPLKYTDPSGNVLVIPAIILAAYGISAWATFTATSPDFNQDIADFHDSLAYAQSDSKSPFKYAPLVASAATIVLPGISSGGRTATTILDNQRLGKLGELLSGVTINTKRINSETGTAKYRIPDILEKSTANLNRITKIGDVKNVKTLRETNQLRDIAATAKKNNIRPELIIDNRTNTKGTSAFLKENNFKVTRKKLR